VAAPQAKREEMNMRKPPHAAKKAFLALSVGGLAICYIAIIAGFLKLIGFQAAMLTMIVSGIGAMGAAIAYVITLSGGLIHRSG
jgi:CHASE2 domain-containing sensor protein